MPGADGFGGLVLKPKTNARDQIVAIAARAKVGDDVEQIRHRRPCVGFLGLAGWLEVGRRHRSAVHAAGAWPRHYWTILVSSRRGSSGATQIHARGGALATRRGLTWRRAYHSVPTRLFGSSSHEQERIYRHRGWTPAVATGKQRAGFQCIMVHTQQVVERRGIDMRRGPAPSACVLLLHGGGP